VAWTSADLLASIKRRAGIPAAQATYTNAEVLTIANEAMLEYVVPLVEEVREDFWLQHHDEPLLDGVLAYPIPSRAIGAKLREVFLIDNENRPINLPRLSPADLVEPVFGFQLDGSRVSLVVDNENVTQLAPTLRLSFFLRPSALVETTAAATISALDTVANTVTLTSVPAGWASGDYDLISQGSPFETLTWDAEATLSGSVLTFVPDLPANLTVGDWVARPQESPVPQIPVEIHGLLAQEAACRILSDKGMGEKLTAKIAERDRMAARVQALLTPRVAGEALRVVNRRSLHRLRW
jgi:hypothetical protein